MPRVIHFEIPANDPEGLAAFYDKVFGWKTERAPGPMEYWLTKTGDGGPGIDGGFLRRRDPRQPACNTIHVQSVDTALESVVANGGVVCLPKMAVPGYGWLAYFADPEGTISGVLEFDPSAQ